MARHLNVQLWKNTSVRCVPLLVRTHSPEEFLLIRRHIKIVKWAFRDILRNGPSKDIVSWLEMKYRLYSTPLQSQGTFGLQRGTDCLQRQQKQEKRQDSREGQDDILPFRTAYELNEKHSKSPEHFVPSMCSLRRRDPKQGFTFEADRNEEISQPLSPDLEFGQSFQSRGDIYELALSLLGGKHRLTLAEAQLVCCLWEDPWRVCLRERK